MLITVIGLCIVVIIQTAFFMYSCNKINETIDYNEWSHSTRHEFINERVSKLEESIEPNVKPPDRQPESVIKRTKPSLRSPLKTYDAYYERYKSKENNLYEPVTPKRKAGRNEVDLDDL